MSGSRAEATLPQSHSASVTSVLLETLRALLCFSSKPSAPAVWECVPSPPTRLSGVRKEKLPPHFLVLRTWKEKKSKQVGRKGVWGMLDVWLMVMHFLKHVLERQGGCVLGSSGKSQRLLNHDDDDAIGL